VAQRQQLRSVGAQAAHRPQPLFELTVVGFDAVVGIPLDVVPGMSSSSTAG
jgi:hypothetical protein